METTPATELVPESVTRKVLDFKERIAFVARLAGNATELARKTGISRRAIGTYLAGTSDPTSQRLVAMAEATGVSIEWLATGRGQAFATPVSQDGGAPSTSHAQAGDFVVVHEYQTILDAAGCTEERIQSVGSSRIAFARDWLEQISASPPEALELIQITCPKVATFGLGEIALLDKGAALQGRLKGLYAVEISGMFCLRRIETLEDRRLRFTPADADQPPLITDAEHTGITIVGKIIWTCGCL